MRTVWAYFVAVAGTLFFGGIVTVASILRRTGPIYSWATRNWARTLLWGAGSRVQAHGLERVDWARPHVLVSNHIGSFDILALAASIPEGYHFVAKKELERIPIFGTAWKAAGHISIDRENRQKALASLRHAAEVMHRDGGVIIIFAEGTRSRTGELQPFKKGAFVLAVEAGVPVIPTVVTDSDRIMPSGTRRIRPGVVNLQFGDPIPVDGLRPEDVDALIQATRERMLGMLAPTTAVTRGDAESAE